MGRIMGPLNKISQIFCVPQATWLHFAALPVRAIMFQDGGCPTLAVMLFLACCRTGNFCDCATTMFETFAVGEQVLHCNHRQRASKVSCMTLCQSFLARVDVEHKAEKDFFVILPQTSAVNSTHLRLKRHIYREESGS